MNNIYAKTVHKEYSTLHELHPVVGRPKFFIDFSPGKAFRA